MVFVEVSTFFCTYLAYLEGLVQKNVLTSISNEISYSSLNYNIKKLFFRINIYINQYLISLHCAFYAIYNGIDNEIRGIEID